MQVATLAEVMLESVLPESYHPKQLRKSNEKTRPMGGGRTPSQVGKWGDFEESLDTWWTRRHRRRSPRDVLTGKHASRMYSRDCLPGISISKEDEVRGALGVCVFAPVNEAIGPSGLQIPFKLNTTESIPCVRSNVDWAGFIIRADASDTVDIFQACRLPVEVKPPWQLQLSPSDGHVVDLLLSPNAADRDKVRFAVAQLYLYMILEEAEFGVLCSKEQYVFFRRIGNPSEKVLLISRTFSWSDPIGIRRCLLFMCHLAHDSRLISMAAVDQAGPTPLKDKLVTPKGQKRKRNQVAAPSGRMLRRKSCLLPEIFNMEKHLPHVYSVPVMLSAQILVPRTSWMRELNVAAGQGLQHWFQCLAEFDLHSFQLGKILSGRCNVVVREACIWAKCAVIKMFDLIEDPQDTLLEFYQEVCAYTAFEHLQGVAVPELLAYGSIWGGYMGFLALKREGHVLTSEELQMQPGLADAAMRSLQLIHGANVLHGDISFHNMVVSTESVKFIDFGRCCLRVKHEYLTIELEELEELLNEGFSSEEGYAVVGRN